MSGMKLSAYRDEEKISLSDFADKIGVTHAAVSRYEHGRVPTPAVMKRIRDATGGQVQPNDFFDSPDEAAA